MVAMQLLERPVHPAQRRRLAAQMPPAAPHEVVLRPLGGGDQRTLIATSSAQDFVAGLFEDLAAADWRDRLARMRRVRKGARDDVLELNQPIHRRFQLALFEAYCNQPGKPRLDPAKITGSGLVIRRIAGPTRKGWMKRGKSIDGWMTVADRDADPAGGADHAANASIRQAIAKRRGATAPARETVHRLYPAPPDVCAAIGRTVLFAVIPVSSAETSDAAADAINYATLPDADRREMVLHLSEYLKDRPPTDMPRKDEVLRSSWNVLDAATLASDARLAALGTFLYQMLVELDALGTGPASRALMAVLAEIRLTTVEDAFGNVLQTIDAATFVRQAGPILIGREANGANVRMPKRWPRVSVDLGRRLTNAALGCLSEQYRARVGAPAKFADDTALYAVRGFIRVAGHDGCPERPVWSVESEPFRILPWWDGEGPGTTIALPDIASLKRIKPSVAFAMPPALGNLLKGDMKDLAEGKGSTDGPGIAWLCSFSIPFITICAFIVLNIFLSLFDLIFRWMLFIKICIPIPKGGK